MVATPDGGLVISDTGANRVRRVDPNGFIHAFAGTGDGPPSGDGGPALTAGLQLPRALALDADGAVFIVDYVSTIRRVDPDGTIATVAGNGLQSGTVGEGGLSGVVEVNAAQLAVAPNREIYFSDAQVQRIRRITAPVPGFGSAHAVSREGTQRWVFSPSGRHLETRETRTNAQLWHFSYDGAGRHSGLTDVDGNTTQVQRDGAGQPIAIVGPFGQTTSLTVDADGYLASVTNPAGEVFGMTYKAGATGLLATLSDPKTQGKSFEYDALGRLTHDADSAGGSQTLTRVDTFAGHTVTRTTAMGRTTTYDVNAFASGDRTRLNTFPSGLHGLLTLGASGVQTSALADGMLITSTPRPDPRFGTLATLWSTTSKTPGNKQRVVARNRTATLSDPIDPVSLLTQTDTVSVNNKVTTTVYTAATKTQITTSPVGRKVTTTLDAKGRVVKVEVPGVLPVQLAYDPQGRLVSTTQGPRVTTRAYDAAGFLQSVTDPLLQVRSFQRDAVGRPTVETRPDDEDTLLRPHARRPAACLGSRLL